MSHYQAFILLFVFGNLFARKTTFASFLDDRKISHCDQGSTLRDTGLLVTHGMPSHYRGVVVIQSKLNRSLLPEDPLCSWSYEVQDLTTLTIVKEDLLDRGSNLSWIFSKLGLRKVSVTAEFDYLGYQRTIKNCTFINVTDCELAPKVQVSTSKGLYNITKNHTDVTVDFPGLTNFTVTVFAIDPYFICKHSDFSWSLGDGSNASGTHVEHHYNKTGVYGVVLKIYKIYKQDSGMKLMGNVTMSIHVVKEKNSSGNTNTVIDVSLVLAIFFVCFVFVICIAGYCFRKRLHRHTEVARFDFRSAELQSSYWGQDSRLGVNCIAQGFMNKATCRRGSNENLLNFEQRGNYLSCSKFDYVDPDEEL